MFLCLPNVIETKKTQNFWFYLTHVTAGGGGRRRWKVVARSSISFNPSLKFSYHPTSSHFLFIFERGRSFVNNLGMLIESFFKCTANLPLSSILQPICLFLQIYSQFASFFKCTIRCQLCHEIVLMECQSQTGKNTNLV